METEALERCDNCQKDFPESKMATHFGYCRRNIKKCQDCGEMYDINFADEHEEEYHKQQQCSHCKKSFPSSEFKQHDKVCELKPKYCEYCFLNVPVSGFMTHFKACESRTKPCNKCNRPIMNKDYLIHEIECRGPVEVPKPANNYQEHINQQRRREQASNPIMNQLNSREKIPVPSNHIPTSYNRPRDSREEKPYANIVNPNKQRVQNKITYEKPTQPVRQQERKEVKINYPTRPNDPRREEIKREQIKREEVKRDEIKREEIRRFNQQPPTNPISNPSRREQNKYQPTSGVGIAGNNPVRPGQITGTGNEQLRRMVGSREGQGGQRLPVSNKEIFPPYQPGIIKGPTVKDSKSIERNGIPKRQEERPKYTNQNVNPKIGSGSSVDKPRISNPPQSRIPPPPQARPPIEKTPNDYSEYSMGGYQISPQEQQLQQIIIQSMNEHKGSKSKQQPSTKPAPSKNTPVYTNEVPYLDGEDFLNESFIEKQKAIEEELARKNKNRR